MTSRSLKYQADGLAMDGELFYEPGSSNKPGILVFPEAFGFNEHALQKAKQLAELGYVALACDLHGGRQAIDRTKVMEVVSELTKNPRRLRARGQGAFDALRACPEVDPRRVAAIGFCFGGTVSLELARSGAPLVAAVGFHSGLATAAPAEAKDIRARVLVCIGADDPLIPPAQRAAFEEEMRAAKVDWQMTLYGGAVHSFTNPKADASGQPQMIRYDAKADARSWVQMRALFNEVF
jgi:dienelactone hydrolase